MLNYPLWNFLQLCAHPPLLASHRQIEQIWRSIKSPCWGQPPNVHLCFAVLRPCYHGIKGIITWPIYLIARHFPSSTIHNPHQPPSPLHHNDFWDWCFDDNVIAMDLQPHICRTWVKWGGPAFLSSIHWYPITPELNLVRCTSPHGLADCPAMSFVFICWLCVHTTETTVTLSR